MAMRVEVLVFGPEAAELGRDRAPVDVADGATCEAVKESLGAAHPALRRFLGAARLAINGEFAAEGQRIRGGDEVALIGLVSGG